MPLLTQLALGLMETIASGSSVATIWAGYMDVARGTGMTHGIACFLPGPERLSDVTFADSMPDGFVRDYSERNLAAADLLCEKLRRCHSPFEWQLSEFPTEKAGGSWKDYLFSHGMQRGFVVPDYSLGDLSVISLIGRPPCSHDRALLHFTGLALLARCRELGVRHGPEIPPLSERERECLQWSAAGKSDWQIGEILNLSDKTVNIYIERAKQKLGVHTRTQAIVRAMRAGIVDL